MTMRYSPPGQQQGFVMILVLAALVLLSLMAARLDFLAEKMREEAQFRIDLQNHYTETRTALDRVLWQMLAQPLTIQGFGMNEPRLRIDGRPHRVDDSLMVSVQDLRGLINLNFVDRLLLQEFLVQQDIAVEDTDAFIDVLLDYIDVDDLVRLNGAETPDYLRAGLPAPRNDWLMHPEEARNMLRWRDKPELLDAISNYATTHSEGWINVNTAPETVLRIMPGATDEGVERLLERRETAVFTDVAAVQAETGIQLPDTSAVQLYPGRFYRVRIWSQLGFPAVEYVVMLTPSYPDRPYQILDTRYVQRPHVQLEDSAIAVFPSLASEANRD